MEYENILSGGNLVVNLRLHFPDDSWQSTIPNLFTSYCSIDLVDIM